MYGSFYGQKLRKTARLKRTEQPTDFSELKRIDRSKYRRRINRPLMYLAKDPEYLTLKREIDNGKTLWSLLYELGYSPSQRNFQRIRGYEQAKKLRNISIEDKLN